MTVRSRTILHAGAAALVAVLCAGAPTAPAHAPTPAARQALYRRR